MAGARHNRMRLRAGLGPLERWSAHSRQAVRNAVYRALFAIGDGSVLRKYRTMLRPSSGELQVDVRDDTVVTVRLAGRDAYDIVYIGDPQEAPDLGRAPDTPE